MATQARDGRFSNEVLPQDERPSRFGPGLIIAASFIGPGTITTLSLIHISEPTRPY